MSPGLFLFGVLEWTGEGISDIRNGTRVPSLRNQKDHPWNPVRGPGRLSFGPKDTQCVDA